MNKTTIKLICNREGCDYCLPSNIEFTINTGEATISEMLEQFDYFLKAMGYYPPHDSHLEYVSEEDPGVTDAEFVP